MKKHILAAVILVTVGALSGVLFEQASAQKKKKPTLKENVIGVIPTEYGKLKGIAGQPNSVILAFESDSGEVFLFNYRGNKINPLVDKISRNY